MLDLNLLQSSSEHPSIIGTLFALLLAFLCSWIVAATYVKTFKGLSYSQNFVQALMLGSIVATIVMQAIGDSVGRGLGMLGALAIVRFRTNIKDSRDIMFLFVSLGLGIACGVSAFWVALIGSLFFSLTAWVLFKNPMGEHQIYDGILRFQSSIEFSHNPQITDSFKKHLKYFTLITLREIQQGQKVELSYQIKTRSSESSAQLVQSLKELPLEGIHLLMQENTGDL